MKIKITNTGNGNGKISIDSPYNPEFISRIKEAGGKWNPGAKTWDVDERSIEVVRTIMREVYGRDDRPQETVTVKVTVGENIIYGDRGPIVLFGRIIASARSRDGGARVGDGISFEKGGADSGGSRKNWDTRISPESVFRIYDVPKLAVEQKLGWNDDYGTFEVIVPEDPLAALRTEKKALLARLAEIEELLAEEK